MLRVVGGENKCSYVTDVSNVRIIILLGLLSCAANWVRCSEVFSIIPVAANITKITEHFLVRTSRPRVRYKLLDLERGTGPSGTEFPVDRRNSINRRSANDLFTSEEEKELLRMHNFYRGNVTPPAGNMAFMEWDNELARSAQDWANGCKFMHGMPPSAKSYGDTIGQNLYRGWDLSGSRALKLWFDEDVFYHYHNLTCDAGQQCGHYTQMAWAESKLLGCGRKKCKKKNYLVVCHYSPAGNVIGRVPYIVGRPCSQCNTPDGGLCLNNLCVTKKQCEKYPERCVDARCPLKCQNCGVLDREACRCRCADGWDSSDCSQPCVDKDEKCGQKGVWPNEFACFLNHGLIGDYYCRKMCGRCNGLTEVEHIRNSSSCCAGSACPTGSVLDLDRRLCTCQLLCPGPKCNYADASSEGKRPVIPTLYIYLLVTIFLVQG